MAKKAEVKALKITLTKSLIGRLKSHIATAHSLGLYKVGDTTVQPKNPATEGKIAKIAYMLNVAED